MARKPDPAARERILDAATCLFRERGVHAVGLQQIIDECGCGKNLLYREFGSKDELVVAFLERCSREGEELMESAARSAPADSGEQLVAMVAAVAEQARLKSFHGCPLRNAYAEFPDPDHPAHQVIVEHYRRRQDRFRDLARRAGARDPDALAARIALIVDGVNANGAILGEEGAVKSAVAFAKEAIAIATSAPGDSVIML